MTSNILRSSAMAEDTQARSMAQDALDQIRDLPASLRPVPWWTDATLAAGVTVSEGAPEFVDGCLKLATAPANLTQPDPSTWAMILTNTISGTVGSYDGTSPTQCDVRPRPAGPFDGREAWEIHSEYSPQTGAMLAPHATGTLYPGDVVWVYFRDIGPLRGAAYIEPRFIMADGGAEAGVRIDFTGNTIFVTGDDVSASLLLPGSPAATHGIFHADNGDGTIEIALPFEAVAEVPGGWTIGLAAGIAGASAGAEFSTPVIRLQERPTAWVPADGSARGQAVRVLDPAASGHHATVPFGLMLYAAKPTEAGVVAEILAESGGQPNQLVVRLTVVDEHMPGELRLEVSENAGSNWTQATLPAAAWASDRPTTIDLRLGSEEAVLFLDGYSATGVPLVTAPGAVNAYGVGGCVDGSQAVAMMCQTVNDAAGVLAAGDQLRLMTATERRLLAKELPGRLYAERA
jgi:hypothetical protein